MATKTDKYELRKKEDNDFYNIDDFNDNMDKIETALTEFDDSGSADGITSFTDMLTKLVTGNKLAVTLRNLKAGLQFVLHAGSIVNNCVTDNAKLPLSAAQGKALQDAIAKLNSELSWKSFANGVSSVDISSLSWKAIHVFIIVNSNNHVTFSIPLVYPLVRASGNEFRFYNFGMYFNSGTYVGGRIGVSIQRIYIDSVLLNGQEVKESSHMWVSYR